VADRVLAEAGPDRVGGPVEPGLAEVLGIVRGEEIELRPRGVGPSLEPRRGEAHEPQRAEAFRGGKCPESRAGGVAEEVGPVGRLGQRRRAGDGAEVAEPELERDAAGAKAFPAKSGRDELGLAEEFGLGSRSGTTGRSSSPRASETVRSA
jgi:hypothetical protein